MTNEAMLKVIYDVMENGVNLPKLQDVVDKLKDDIALEKCSNVTEKHMLTACKKLLKGASDQRPVLKKTDMQEIDGATYQVMTDSFCAVWLKKPFDLPRVSEDEKYPDMKKIVSMFFNRDPFDKVVMTYKEAVTRNKTIKREDKVKIDEIMFKGEPMRFNSDMFVNLFKCLGTNEATIYAYKDMYGFKPMKIVPNDNDNGFALLVPIKTYD